MTYDVVELFAGPGGLSEGLRLAAPDLRAVGLEWEQAACATRAASGHATIRTDVAAYPTHPFRGVRGVAGAPPCQTFSLSGKGEGRKHIDSIKRAARYVAGGADPRDALARVNDDVLDERTMLVLQPLRWARDLLPEWVLLEEVPQVLPVWQAIAHELERLGYHTWTGVLDAECYGVPQTRDRAFLLAHQDRRLGAPPATHRRYDKRLPDRGRYGADAETTLLGDGLLPWVSMADVLGWPSDDLVGFPRLADNDDTITLDGVDYRARDLRAATEPAFTLTEKARSAVRLTRSAVLRNGSQANACIRALDEPAGTLFFGHQLNDVSWYPNVEAARPGQMVGVDAKREAVRIEVAEAAALQSFPRRPWKGTRTRVFQQIGNAVPPLLAAHVGTHLLGRGVPQDVTFGLYPTA